ncbi:MAG: ribonuclease P protein component 4 [Candidatus Micrarchaeia archaeon]
MKNKKIVINNIAKERIETLFKLAIEELGKDDSLSKRYIHIMKRISEHYKVSLPKEIKNNVCKKCGMPLLPGYNANVRIASNKHYIVYKCRECGNERHIHY